MLDRDAFESLMQPYFDPLRTSLAQANREFVDLQRTNPVIARSLSARRGRPNLLHDLIWAYLLANLEDSPDVVFLDDNGDREPDPTKREAMWFNGRVLMRVKQHQRGSLEIRNFPTATARAFITQGTQLALDLESGEEITPTHVALGYTFSEQLGRMDRALITARVARRELVWLVDLGDPASGTAVAGTTVPAGGPQSGPPDPKPIPRPSTGQGSEEHTQSEETGEA